MRIGLAQINSHLGAFRENAEKILQYGLRAQSRRCELVVFPELSLFGYHPGDLLERASIVEAQLKELERLQERLPPGIVFVIGAVLKNPRKQGPRFINAAVVGERDKKWRICAKELHPTYDVFDDRRHFAAGSVEKNLFTHRGKKILVTVCEDLWAWDVDDQPSRYEENPLLKVARNDVDVILNLSASPYTENKLAQRRQVVSRTAQHFKAPVVYVNLVGGQDELIFDGGSFAVDAKGAVLAQNQSFEEDLNVVDLELAEGNIAAVDHSIMENNRRALVLGIRDFAYKTGLQKVHLGLSGGIDSALVTCLAVDALGPNHVTCVALPGPFSADESLFLAKALCTNLGCTLLEMPIESAYQAALRVFEQGAGATDFGLVQENMQARLRGLLLMALANKQNSLLLTTGNKSEYATGYATLYGDMCGALAPIADLVKGKVYQMAELYNREYEVIPRRIIERPPTAELRPNQRDQDTLPEYADLDRAVVRLVEEYAPARGELEKWTLNALMKSEFKRWQAPPVLKLTEHSFGRGRRLPVAQSARA